MGPHESEIQQISNLQIGTNIFTYPTSYRGLISKIKKNSTSYPPKLPNNPNEKWSSELNRELIMEEFKWPKST